MGLGAAGARNAAIVVLVDEFRLTRLTSASVPVFTDQRSTPHWANNEEGRIRIVATNSNHVRRDVLMLFLRPALDCDQLLSPRNLRERSLIQHKKRMKRFYAVPKWNWVKFVLISC